MDIFLENFPTGPNPNWTQPVDGPMYISASLLLLSSSSSSSAAEASSSRWALHQVTSDEQGDHDDHVTERWRHHRPVAQLRVAQAFYTGASRQTMTAKLFLALHRALTNCTWNDKYTDWRADFAVSKTRHGRGNRGAGGSNDPRKFIWGSNMVFWPSAFLKRNIFWHTGQLILSKIIKTVATRCQILSLKCTKFDFGWGSAPYPAPPYP